MCIDLALNRTGSSNCQLIRPFAALGINVSKHQMTLFILFISGTAVWLAFKLGANSRANSSTINSHARVDKDEWEGSFWEVAQPLPAKVRLRIKYTDGAGRNTERTVDVRQFGAFGTNTLIIGHCNMRDETRTFRSDRIRSCIDEDTGEVISDVSAYLQQRYESSLDRTRDLLLEGEYDTLRILLYVGKADGQLRTVEKDVIRDTCVALTKDSRLTNESIDDLLSRMKVPTLQAFKLAVGRVAKREQAVQVVVVTASEKMIATQGSVHQAEQEALNYMRKSFLPDKGGM